MRLAIADAVAVAVGVHFIRINAQYACHPVLIHIFCFVSLFGAHNTNTHNTGAVFATLSSNARLQSTMNAIIIINRTFKWQSAMHP